MDPTMERLQEQQGGLIRQIAQIIAANKASGLHEGRGNSMMPQMGEEPSMGQLQQTQGSLMNELNRLLGAKSF